MFKKQKKYFNYISRNILILLCSFFLFLSLILYVSYSNFIKSTYTQAFTNNSSQAADVINNSIEQTNYLTYLISSENYIKDFVNTAGEDVSKKMAAMSYLKTGSLFKGQVAVAIPEKQAVITNSATMSFSYYISSHKLNSSEFESNIEDLLSGAAKSPIVFFPSQNSSSFFVIHHINIFDYPVLVSYKFDLSTILPKINFESNFCITQNDKLVSTIGSFSTERINEAISNKSENLEILPQTVSSISHIKKGQCFYVTPVNGYILHANRFILSVLFFLALFVLLSYFIARIVSKRIYQPINTLMDAVKDADSTDSSNNELELISKKISSLSDKNKVLFDILESHSKQLSDIFISNLFKGNLSKDEIKDGLTKYEFNNFKFPATVFVAKIVDFDALDDFLDVSGIQMIQNDIIEKFTINFTSSELKIISMESNKFAGILSVENMPHQKDTLSSCISDIETILGIRLRLSVGSPVRDWNKVSASYNTANNIFDNFYFSDSSPSVIIADEATKNSLSLHYPSDLENELIEAVLYNQEDDIKKATMKLIDLNCKNGMLDVDLHRQLVMTLVSTLSKVFLALNKQPNDVLSDDKDIYQSLIKSKNPESLKSEFLRIAYAVSEYAALLKNSSDQKVAQSMLSYIYENYEQYEISLSGLASYLNMSQSHVSRLFKSLIGENFKDYLAKYRIQIAKSLLDKNPSTKTKDLAKQVGYSNSETFTKAFKRYEGCSPSEYVKSNR